MQLKLVGASSLGSTRGDKVLVVKICVCLCSCAIVIVVQYTVGSLNWNTMYIECIYKLWGGQVVNITFVLFWEFWKTIKSFDTHPFLIWNKEKIGLESVK